jgi:hypothetical protein
MTRLRDILQSNWASIPGRQSSPKRLELVNRATYQLISEALSSGLKRQRREVDDSYPSSAEVKIRGVIPALCHMPSHSDA